MALITLRGICLVVAWMHLLFASAAIALLIFLAIYTKKVLGKDPQYAEILQLGFLVSMLYFVLNVIRLGIAVLLVKGIHQSRRSLMAPFICCQFGIIIFFVTLTIVDAFWDLKHGVIKYSLLDFLLDGLHVALTSLFLWPVCLLYQRMRSNSEPNTDTNVKRNTAIRQSRRVKGNAV